MKRFILAVLATSLVMMFSCGASPATQTIYSKTENDKLVYCIALSDIAFHVAQQKKNGVSIEVVNSEYASAKDPLIDELIKKIYREEFDSALAYQRGFFHDCGITIAHISADRMGHADFCNTTQFLAGVIYALKDSGKTREQTKVKLKIKPGSLQESIVDAVYNAQGTRIQIKVGMWNSCLQSMEKH